MAELNVSIVSAERAIWRGQAKSVVAKTPDGEIGILPGHSPVLALLLDAPLRIETTEGTKVLAAVHGGFFSVDSDTVNVIAETAELAEEIDVVRAKAALDRARSASAEDDPAVAAAKRAETRLAVAVGSR
ncbi:MAG: F0F1 ATP synthase subunit epsilon [Candidatus Nanopelagicales bacterium]|nr:F0F1 ATP synthase subunit epsilon [Candidatus Nanopelagicales bacterium]MDP4905939.1 F0F1 ATP synthase subunit epsilon [Candidatus Nanopelagicales bacterium]MDP4975047.1 F0F1 ATP synthase subunit epsilon [Candidatus Nanopelagicales bacterium]